MKNLMITLALVLTVLATACTTQQPQQTVEQSQPQQTAQELPKQLAPSQKEQQRAAELEKQQVDNLRNAFSPLGTFEAIEGANRQMALDALLCEASTKLSAMDGKLSSGPVLEKEWIAAGLTEEEAKKRRQELKLFFINKLGEVAALPSARREAMSRDWQSCDGTIEVQNIDGLVDLMTWHLEEETVEYVNANVRATVLANLKERMDSLRKKMKNGSADEVGNALGDFDFLISGALGTWKFRSSELLTTQEVDDLLKRYLPASRLRG